MSNKQNVRYVAIVVGDKFNSIKLFRSTVSKFIQDQDVVAVPTGVHDWVIKELKNVTVPDKFRAFANDFCSYMIVFDVTVESAAKTIESVVGAVDKVKVVVTEK